MKKYLPMIMMLFSSIGFIGFSFFLFPNKHKMFTQVYEAKHIIIEAHTDLIIYEPYEENDKVYIEIVSVKEIEIKLLGEVVINGIKSDETTIYTKGKNILIESDNVIHIKNTNYRVDKVNTENAVDYISIGAGTIAGIILVAFLWMSQLPKNLKFGVGLTLTTIVVFFLAKILNDMFWVLFWADVGFLGGSTLTLFKRKT